MSSPLGLPSLVQCVKVSRVVGQQNVAVGSGIGEVVRVFPTFGARRPRRDDRMTCLSKKGNQAVMVRTLVKVDSE